jgi:4-alpha-glucanotransferase
MRIDLSKKLAGLLVPTFALRTENDLGVGDTSAMKEAIDFCSRNGIGILQVLPINETGGDNSPYNAISSAALDPELLSVTPDSVPYLDREFFNKTIDQCSINSLREGPVNHPQVKKLKLALLKNAFDNFISLASASERMQWDRFKERNATWLEHYVLFRALVDEQNGDARWPLWPATFSNPEKAKEWLSQASNASEIKKALELHGFVQWLAEEQWLSVRAYAEERAVSLMGDIPFGVSRYSADVWAQPWLFDLDWSGGAPPEKFFATDEFVRKWGQNWGVPIYRWDEHEKDNFAWWRRRIHSVTKIFHYFRIDHVLGFFRVYAFPWIPERNDEFVELTEEEAFEKTGGKLPRFVPRDDETEENRELNCADGKKFLEMTMDAAGNAGIVAEDLGIVPPYCRPLLDKLSIPGFYVPLFERNESDRSYKTMAQIPRLSLATYGTHDHEPIVSFYENLVARWHGPDGDNGWQEIRRLMRFLDLDPDQPPEQYNNQLAESFFETLLNSDTWLAVLMVTDLLGLKLRFNEPGPASPYNWSQRLAHPLAWYESNEPFSTYIQLLKNVIARSERLPKIEASLGAESIGS